MEEFSEGNFFDPASHAALSSYFFIPDNEIKADVTFVLGMTLWQRPVVRVLELYRKGLAGQIIFTGGYNSKIGQPEAEAMAVYARSCGIPGSNIHVEPVSGNTRENFINCLQLMDALGLPGDDCRINIVTISFHMRRALLTLQDVSSSRLSVGTASYPSVHYSDSGWHQTMRGQHDLFQEMKKVATYFPGIIPVEMRQIIQSYCTEPV